MRKNKFLIFSVLILLSIVLISLWIYDVRNTAYVSFYVYTDRNDSVELYVDNELIVDGFSDAVLRNYSIDTGSATYNGDVYIIRKQDYLADDLVYIIAIKNGKHSIRAVQGTRTFETDFEINGSIRWRSRLNIYLIGSASFMDIVPPSD